MIKDSGNRREFETGAVRDIQEGKGRCDLLPLDVIGECVENRILTLISAFQATRNPARLTDVLYLATIGKERQERMFDNFETMILEVSIHFEEGCKKYGERNWEKGIPIHCYIDSAVRHYLKWCRGDTDERHDRAFVWNILCCIWTLKHIPREGDASE